MITISYAPGDTTLAQKLKNDLHRYGISDTLQTGREHLLIAVLSLEAEQNRKVQTDIETTLDNHQHVIPVLAAPVKLPRVIDHLQPLDFIQAYPIDALKAQIEYLTGPGAPPPLTTHTPAVRAANRRAGYVLFGVAFLIFVTGVIAVGSGFVRRPDAEYDAVNTQAAATIHFLADPQLETAIPRSTDDALNFESTLRALPTGVRPLAIATATAQAAELGE